EIRHDRILPGVIGIDRIRGVRRASVVGALMAQTERVTDLVNVGLVGVAIYSGLAVVCAAVVGDPIGADVDGCGNNGPGAGIAVGLKGSHGTVVIERDVRGTRSLNEIDVGYLVPCIQRRLGEELLRGRQAVDVVGYGR